MEWVRRALLMTDVERSTLLWQEDPAAMSLAIARHDQIVAEVVESNRGRLIKSRGEGDSTFSVFDSAHDAALAAVEMQRAIRSETWNLSRGIATRAAINFGEIEDRAGDCYGPEVNKCARLRGAAHPGQVLATSSVHQDFRRVGPASRLRFEPLGRHRLKDLADPVEVYQVTASDSEESFSPILSLNASAGFLPKYGFGFLCRSKELREVCSLLRRQSLVTITGPGGFGKTRLAVEAARSFTDWVPDGTHFVDLSEMQGAGNLPAAIAASMRLRPEASVDLESLTAELSKKEALLLLDGCEHAANHAKTVVQSIVHASPMMRILVTSRTPLKVGGEQVFRLKPLALPRPSADADEIETAEAVRFFVERARLARHDFSVTSRNARAIFSICEHLDGIPTALEMAATRVRSLTPEQIASRLSTRYRAVAQGGSHETLKALFDWSWDSLGSTEQRFAWCTTIFEGTFDLEAAEAVCEQFEASNPPAAKGGGFLSARIDPFEAVDAIDSLVERSLLIAEQSGDSMRYRLSSTFREYVLEKWPEPSPSDILERAHANYYRLQAPEMEPFVLREEAPNISRAVRYFLSIPAGDEAAGLALTLTHYWQSSGLYAEGCSTMRACLDIGPGEPLNTKLLNAIGLFEYYLGQRDQAREHLLEASRVAEASEDEPLRSKTLNNLALVYMAEGETDSAITSLEQAIPFDRRYHEESQLAVSLSNLGYLRILKGDLAVARETLQEALQVTGTVDDRRTAIPCLCNLSDLAIEERRLEEAAAFAQRGMSYAEKLDDAVGIACCLANLGEVSLRSGEFDEAELQLRRALARCIDMNATWLIGSILDLLTIVYWRKTLVEPASQAIAHRRVAATVPSPPRFAAEVQEISELVGAQVGAEAMARLRHRAEKDGIFSLLDQLPRAARH